MKTLIATAALVALIAVPAQAQTVDRRPLGAQPAPQYGRTEVLRPGISSSVPVYDGSRYLGADPDPNVRLNLRMDWEHHD